MCVGPSRKDQRDKENREEPPREQQEPQDYSQMFREAEARLVQYRALLMRRLVQDPFYLLMNVSPASRIWMLRYLKHLCMYAKERHNITLLEFFERMRLVDVLYFFRSKNAPNEMADLWARMHPAPEPADPVEPYQPA